MTYRGGPFICSLGALRCNWANFPPFRKPMRKLYLGEQKRVTLIFCCAATPFSTNQRAQLAGHCSLWSLCLLWLFPSFLGSHVNDSLAEPFSKGGEWIIRAGGLMSLRRQDFFFCSRSNNRHDAQSLTHSKHYVSIKVIPPGAAIATLSHSFE